MITGNAMVCGVMGDPVGHSLSPLMHNYIAQAMGLDYIYVPCHVRNDRVGDAVRGAYALGMTGVNVTVPYKQRVIPFLRETDESVRCIGACNTLVRLENEDDGRTETEPGDAQTAGRGAGGGYKGYNTDAEGLYRAMKKQGMEIEGRDCILLGAGGAARAAAYLLVREKAASVTVLNRSAGRAEELAEHIRRQAAERGQEMEAAALPIDQWSRLPGDSYLAVQTTSVGMYPEADAAPIEEPAFYEKIHQAVDIVYTPSRTRFMAYVEAAGGQAAGGLDMLIFQGIAALELWNRGLKVPEAVVNRVRQVMEEQLNGRR